ncbi:uncharacterized protein FYW61_019667 [Anableps anableps]
MVPQYKPTLGACLQIASTLASNTNFAELQPRSLRGEIPTEIKIFKMLCSRCVLPLLALYMLLEQISAAVIPRKPKREVNWPDHEVLSHISVTLDMGDLSVGDAGEIQRVVDDRSETIVDPTLSVSIQSQNKNQNTLNRKANDKRRKVAPLDSIGRFQIPSTRNRKEKKSVYGEN